MTNRRKFIKQMAAAGLVGSMPSALLSQTQTIQHRGAKEHMIWANLLHLSNNMWQDHTHVVYDNLPADTYAAEDFEIKSCMDARRWARAYRTSLVFEDKTWDSILQHMVLQGMNMVVIDLGDGVKYKSHPEIAVKNAWSTEKLKAEIAKMRRMGLEPIPKLNFATTHAAWLGEYSRMVSTEKYYTVCKNLINEVINLFDTPRFFHLGMDEETYSHQKQHNYVTIRQGDLWWHDFYMLIEEVEKNNVRPWIWSDYAWRHPDVFFRKMPKSVLQSNWYYYNPGFDLENLEEPFKTYVGLYNKLEEHGYDQVPTGSNTANDTNMMDTVNYCKDLVDSSRLKGFMTATWRPTLPACLNKHKEAIDQVGRAIRSF